MPVFLPTKVVNISLQSSRTTHIPKVDCTLLGHQLIDSKPPLRIEVSACGMPDYLDTYVHEVCNLDADEASELAVPFIYLPGPSPQTRGNAHSREHSVIIK